MTHTSELVEHQDCCAYEFRTGVGIRAAWLGPIFSSPNRAGPILSEPDRAEKTKPDPCPIF